MKGSMWIATAALLVAAPAAAQGTTGTLLVAHGGSAGWNARVEQVARDVRTGGPVRVSFLMGDGASRHRFQDAVDSLVGAGATRVVVVPLLVSSYSGHYEQVRWLAGQTDSLDEEMMHHLHMAGITRASGGVPISITRAFDDAPEMARVLAEHARRLAPNDYAQRALFLMAHGPNDPLDHAAWMQNLRAVADSVRRIGGFRDVKVGVVRDDAPAPVRAEAVKEIRDLVSLQAAWTGRPVVVIPVLVSSGEVGGVKFPRDLEGLSVVYDNLPLLPEAPMARWIETRVREAAGRAMSASR
jgi:sirohydrochlorin ferrochelatase